MPTTTSRRKTHICPFCQAPAPLRYPGGDPENGPAVPTCQSQECAATLKAQEPRDIADGVALAMLLLADKGVGGKYRPCDVHGAIEHVLVLQPRFSRRRRTDVALRIEEEVLTRTGILGWQYR